MDKLQGVADTLFIPLAARIYVSKRFPTYFYDERALSLEGALPNDGILRASSEYSCMASAARSYNLDAMTRAFLAAHGRGNVIYLGAGLETAYFRLGQQAARFYEVDLPPVIAGRRALLGEQPNEVLIAGDLFDLAWARQVDQSLPSLLIVSGVFQYFHREEILPFLHALGQVFPGGELIFDATNETGIKYASRYVRKTGNASAPMYFFVNSGADFARESGLTLLEQRPFFTDARRLLSRQLGLYTRIAMRVVDGDGRAILLRLRLGQ